jgi:hypothetical protein
MPPAAETRLSPPVALPKIITPSRVHAPPRTKGIPSQRTWGRPPEISIFLSLPSAKNARNRLSGDQNDVSESW